MQADTGEEFSQRLDKAAEKYEQAIRLYDEFGQSTSQARALRCRAMAAHIRTWRVPDAQGKRSTAEDSWNLTREALKLFMTNGDLVEYVRTYNHLFQNLLFQFDLSWERESRENILKEGAELGERAIEVQAKTQPKNLDPDDLAGCYIRTADCIGAFAGNFLDLKEREKQVQKAHRYWLRANELSEKRATLESNPFYRGGYFVYLDTNEFLAFCQRELECATETKDKFLVGWALDWLEDWSFRKALGKEHPAERASLLDQSLHYAEEAKRQYSSILFTSPKAGPLWAEAPYGAYYRQLALFEGTADKKRVLFKKALESSREGMERAKQSGYPGVIRAAHNSLSKIMADLSKLEEAQEDRKILLDKALEHRTESNRITDQLEPLFYWDRGSGLIYLADIKADLATLSEDPEAKKTSLLEAVSHMESGLNLCAKQIQFWERTVPVTENIALVSKWRYEFGGSLENLHSLTLDPKHLTKAISECMVAAESFSNLGFASRSAECYWRAALAYDALGDHLNAARNFSDASLAYKKASETIPQLKKLYSDLTQYMQAWNEIEQARNHHAQQEYGLAEEEYTKAADRLKSTEHWSNIEVTYSAWAQLERAEKLSRAEETQAAIVGFQKAAGLFQETKKSFQRHLARVDDPEEQQMMSNLMQEANPRRDYCMGRVSIEEAKLLDRGGDHRLSSEKYGEAIELLQNATHGLVMNQDRQEIQPIVMLSRAWQTLTRAEAEGSPRLFLEASDLFDQAKQSSSNERSRALAAGHSQFCKALECEAAFAEHRDLAMHEAAVHHIEEASRHYIRAELGAASDYANATKLLFEAYHYMDKAAIEQDQEKEARLYSLAEKVLQESETAFTKAHHPEKSKHVEKLLEKVREERKLALSLKEVFQARSVMSSTNSFSSPSPSSEIAVGLERFEGANVNLDLKIRETDHRVNENLEIALDFANAGNGNAQLVMVEKLIPEEFEAKEIPENCTVESGNLNLRGRSLGPLKTETVRVILRPMGKGRFMLKPRVVYLDEHGRNKSTELEAIPVIVREMGISGWLRGPPRKRPRGTS